ncbi:DHA2 family efflux MFS transporter permease subunit [Caulobacter sp. RHG1]|uniref:DHA2 family efflux MFS transporter permease subunit n=1 Tax=Caulobacter sp. (strain RHG1) TaxID=2545762 RepID=UPI0015546A20|nr:DHA2 family efflux MFS transporter permease subunit [Caulobacter sp. RHG1]NQE62225.1 Inner-membrane proton/drug antiporter (MSF type) of tripartite multidrug efflux system [Caulobacter sp. RHG1]
MTDAATSGAPPSGAPQSAPAEINWTKLMLGFGAMVIGQFMAILDIQIVAASLPQIQAGVGASTDQISWIQTAYLIPEVVMIPLSGYLSRLWGTQRLYLASCVGFMVMSVLTGLSTSIDMMILTRALQGFIGGAMIPTVFAVAFTAFPPERRITASVIMGLIVTLAPTVGPTLGGHLTESLSWRWLFFINVPTGLIVLFGVARWGDFDKGDPSLAKGFDWFGLAVMAIFLMSMQFVLEEGAKDDWFDDSLILWLTVTAVIGGGLFIWRQLTYRNPIVELRAFSNRNFMVGVVMTAVSGASLFGGTFLLPQFLGRVRHYSASEVGTTMIVSGLSMFLTGPIAGRLVRKTDPRVPMCLGFLLAGWGMYMAHGVTKDWGFWEFAGVQACRGVGVMIAMIATQQVTMSTLPPHMVKNASGLVNLSRNTGGAIGLALLATSITQQTALYYDDMTSKLTAGGNAASMLTALTQRMAQLGVADPGGAARKAIGGMLQQQATVMAFGDAFTLLAIGSFVAAGVSLLAAPVKNAPPPPSDAH